MPILIKDVQFSDTPTILYITLPLRNTASQKVNVYCNPLYLSVNYPPYFYEIDLQEEIDSELSVSKIGAGQICVELVKTVEGMWKAPYKCEGVKEAVLERRKKAETVQLEKERKLKEAKLSAKREEEREQVRKQILVEREKRERVEALKENEKTQAAEGIRKWAEETLGRQRSSKQADSAVDLVKNVRKDDIFPEDAEEEFVDDDDIDMESIRAKVSQLMPTVPPPRESRSMVINFSNRDKIPTKTARETQDGNRA
jgi:dyslexia susceptibility 1 candidate gene 1 protein